MTNQKTSRSVVQHQDVVEYSLQGIVVVANEGMVFANQALASMTGYSVQELESFSLEDLWKAIHPDDRQMMIKRREERINGRPVPERYEFKFLHKEGGELLLEVRPTIINTENGPIVQAYVVDKSDRWRAEQAQLEAERQLCHAQKMEAVGMLAGGIAHDFNNFLSVIIGNLDLLKAKALLQKDELMLLETVERVARDASTLTNQLLKFARKDEVKSDTVNIGQLLDEVIEMIEPTLNKKITVVKNVLVDRPVVQGDPVQLKQVFMNLASNANDAMLGGGELRFTMWEQVSEQQKAVLENNCGNRQLVVAVADTGAGIPEEIRNRIFEPLFTTKEHGTGMGLAMVFSILKNHRCSISVESVPGNGTIFKIIFSEYLSQSTH